MGDSSKQQLAISVAVRTAGSHMRICRVPARPRRVKARSWGTWSELGRRVIGGTWDEGSEITHDLRVPICNSIAYTHTAHVAASNNVMDFLKSCWTNLQAVVSLPLTQELLTSG